MQIFYFICHLKTEILYFYFKFQIYCYIDYVYPINKKAKDCSKSNYSVQCSAVVAVMD